MPRRRRKSTTRPTNKENVALKPRIMFIEHDEAPIQKVTQVIYSPTMLVKGKWTNEDLKETMEGCKFF